VQRPSCLRRSLRRRVRRGVAAVVLAAALPVVSGCASGFDSPVLQNYTPTAGANVRGGDVYAMNMLVVASDSGTSGTLVGSLLNKTPTRDALVGAAVRAQPGEPQVRSSMLTSDVPLLPERLVELSEPPTMVVRGDVTPGRFVTLTLVFQRAEQIRVQVPVVPHTEPYDVVPLPGEGDSSSTSGDDSARTLGASRAGGSGAETGGHGGDGGHTRHGGGGGHG
jgi:uncharacterized membrane protein YgcG